MMELSKADSLLKESYEKQKTTRKKLSKKAIERRLKSSSTYKKGTP